MNYEIKNVLRKLPKSKSTTLSKNHKVALAVGDELENLSNEASKNLDKLRTRIDNAFVPIREIEKIVSNMAKEISGLDDFTNSLMKFEEQYHKDYQRVNELSEELGMQIPMPPSIEEAVRSLEYLQTAEQEVRDDINEFMQELKMLGY